MTLQSLIRFILSTKCINYSLTKKKMIQINLNIRFYALQIIAINQLIADILIIQFLLNNNLYQRIELIK